MTWRLSSVLKSTGKIFAQFLWLDLFLARNAHLDNYRLWHVRDVLGSYFKNARETQEW